MADEDGFNDEFDSALEDILPEDLEDSVQEAAAEAGHEAPVGAWLRQQYSLTQGMGAVRRDEIAQQEIEALVGDLEVSATVQQMATSLFTQYADTADRPFLIELYAAASLYCACKVNEVPVSPSEVAAIGSDLLTRKVLLRRSKRIASTLGLDASAFIEPTQYVDRYCAELGVTAPVSERAKTILDVAADAGLTSGKSPRGLAAAAIYNATLEQGVDITQADIAAAADVTEVTIRNRYQEQREALNQKNAAPTNPMEAADWAATRLETPATVPEQTRKLLQLAREKLPSDVYDRDLALAVLRIVSEERSDMDPLSYRALRGLTESQSSDIRARRRRIKEALRWSITENVHPTQ